MNAVLTELWPYLMLVLLGYLPNEVWRVLGLVLVRGLNEEFGDCDVVAGGGDRDPGRRYCQIGCIFQRAACRYSVDRTRRRGGVRISRFPVFVRHIAQRCAIANNS